MTKVYKLIPSNSHSNFLFTIYQRRLVDEWSIVIYFIQVELVISLLVHLRKALQNHDNSKRVTHL